MKLLVNFMADFDFQVEKSLSLLSVLISLPAAKTALVEWTRGIPALVTMIEVVWQRLMEAAMVIVLQILNGFLCEAEIKETRNRNKKLCASGSESCKSCKI